MGFLSNIANRIKPRRAALGGSFVGASGTRRSLAAWTPYASGPDVDLDDLETLRSRSRDLYRNTPLATSAVNTLKTNVVGPGLRLQSRMDREFLGLADEAADKWERNVEREFSLWADSTDSDITRTQNFYDLQALGFLSVLLSGDAFVLLPTRRRPGRPYDLKVQLIEADRVENPSNRYNDDRLAGGVEIDRDGAPVAYHIRKKHPGEYLTTYIDESDRVPAFGRQTGRRNVLHLYDKLRPGQRRGYPYLTPVIESLKQLGRYQEAELMAAVVASMFTVFVKSESTGLESPYGQNPGFNPGIYEMGNGSIVGLLPGEDIEIADPKRPNEAFGEFNQNVIQNIGAALDIPYELLVKHWSASYSASRASLLEAWKFISVRRAWLSRYFCQPIFEEWLFEAVTKGRIIAPGFLHDAAIRAAYSKAVWVGPAQGLLDPLKEVTAARKRNEAGYTSIAEETQAMTGGDFEQTHRQRVKEEKMRREGRPGSGPE